MTTLTEPMTRTLEVPGAVLAYDVQPNEQSTERILLLIGSPMGAAGFGTLAGHFADRTVITYDPRGVERSTKNDPGAVSTPEEHADDLHRLIEELSAGPVDCFASSGGAVNALMLVATHRDDLRTLVAHEPPAENLLPDHDAARAASRAVHETYLRDGYGAGMAHFIALVMHKGPFADDWADQPPPDPATFGLPTEDDGTRDDPLLGQNIETGTEPNLDFDALLAASTRVVIAVGAESDGELANRAGRAAAERLGAEPVVFPSNHGGFLGGEYGQTGEPAAFAAKLRQVLEER